MKQYHIDDILPFVEGASSLIFLQNGMSHLPKMLQIGSENIAVGIVEHGAKKEQTGSDLKLKASLVHANRC